jgi:hypothetical protein
MRSDIDHEFYLLVNFHNKVCVLLTRKKNTKLTALFGEVTVKIPITVSTDLIVAHVYWLCFIFFWWLVVHQDVKNYFETNFYLFWPLRYWETINIQLWK